MAEVLSQAIFVEADVTYPGNLSFPYLLNIVTYNEETMVFQTVARVLLNKLTTAAYRRAFEEVFQITTNLHPCFNGGREVLFWIVDFSSAQYEGLAANIGKKEARARIVGCKVHFQRNARKIAAKICGPDRNSLDLFTSIAYKIPDLTEESQVFAAFDILSGETLLRMTRRLCDSLLKLLASRTKRSSERTHQSGVQPRSGLNGGSRKNI